MTRIARPLRWGWGLHQSCRYSKFEQSKQTKAYRGNRYDRCFTDGNGPDVFQKCTTHWVHPDMRTKDDYDRYDQTQGHGACDFTAPPSAHNKVCKSFHEKIKELR